MVRVVLVETSSKIAHQDGAAFELDAVYHLRRQVHRLAGPVVEPPQPVLDAVHLRLPSFEIRLDQYVDHQSRAA